MQPWRDRAFRCRRRRRGRGASWRGGERGVSGRGGERWSGGWRVGSFGS